MGHDLKITPTGSTIGVLRFIYTPLRSGGSPWHVSIPRVRPDPPIPPVLAGRPGGGLDRPAEGEGPP